VVVVVLVVLLVVVLLVVVPVEARVLLVVLVVVRVGLEEEQRTGCPLHHSTMSASDQTPAIVRRSSRHRTSLSCSACTNCHLRRPHSVKMGRLR